MASLLKPQPPPRPAGGPAGAAGRAKAHVPSSAAFDLLMREIGGGLPAGRGRSTSRGRVPAAAQPSSARVPSAQRRRDSSAHKAQQQPLSARNPASGLPLGDLTNLQRTAAGGKPPASSRTASSNQRNNVPSDAATSTPTGTPRGAPSSTTGSGLSWQEAAGKYASSLTAFEAREIQSYPTVYYCGERCQRKVHGVDMAGSNNHGYDDSQGDYRVIMEDHVAYRYQVLAPLGRGSFGQVSKALDHKTGQQVALKIIKNKKKFHEQALVEVKVLKHLNSKDPEGTSHVVKMVTYLKFRNHMVIVFELHGQSLYDLHKAHRFAPMTTSAIRGFARQMLQTLVLTHKEHVVHCDMKPENVLLLSGSKSKITVIDFGSACFDSERLYTYIQSRFYRAPEVLLGIPYTPQIDVWSLGCMLAEFSNGYPLMPGESEGEQMQLIMETFGLPPRSMLDRSPRKRVFFDATGTPKLTPNSRGKIRRPGTKNLANFVQCTDPHFLDLLQRMLTYEPERRITPSEALRHPFFGAGEATSVHPHPPSSDAAIRNAPDVHLPRLQHAVGAHHRW